MTTGKKEVSAMSYDLTHARHDAAHCLAPGLFRSLKRGERKKLKLDVTYTFGEDRIEFSGPEPLGTDDMRVLQGLVAMAATSGESGRGILLKPDTQSPEGEQLRLFLDLRWDAAEQDSMIAKGSYRQLAKELGYATDSGGSFKTIRESIERLWKVSVIVQRAGKRQGFRILSEYASDEDTGKLFVALNPRLADAIVGTRPHTRIELSEVRALETDPARLMHQRLCGWIDPGKSGRVAIDSLCGYVWPDAPYQWSTEERKKSSLRRQHHMKIRQALEELTALGWTANEYVKGKFEIGRPTALP